MIETIIVAIYINFSGPLLVWIPDWVTEEKPEPREVSFDWMVTKVISTRETII